MAEQTKEYRQRWIALAFLSCSLLIISLDNTIMNLALPTIARDLGSSASDLQWVVDAYILAIAGLLLTLGYIGDRIGRKPMLQIGLILFALFSLGAAFSTSNGMLMVMRALMGIGAATIMPATLSTITATFRDPRERGQAIAMWAAVWSLGTGIGPLIGGWLLQNFHWSSIFLINIPVVIIALVGGFFYIQNSRNEKPRRIDITGALLSIGGLFSLVYAIIRAGNSGWTDQYVLLAFAAAAILLAIFVIWEMRSPNAMLPLDFFRNMSFTGANIALTLVTFGLFGAFFFISQFMQSVLGYTPLESGIRQLPMVTLSAVSAAMSARVARKIGTKFTVSLGILVAGIGLFYFSRIVAVDTPYMQLVIAMCITSSGIGMVMSPATNSVMGSIPAYKAGVGSGMNDTTRQVGGALGVAIVGTVLNSVYVASINAYQWPADLPPQSLDVIRSSIQAAHVLAGKVTAPQLAQIIIDESNRAFVAGAHNALMVSGFILVAASIAAAIILPSRIQSYQEPDMKSPQKH
jgi:EmrB/QacA subfamily drug resistance transporter